MPTPGCGSRRAANRSERAGPGVIVVCTPILSVTRPRPMPAPHPAWLPSTRSLGGPRGFPHFRSGCAESGAVGSGVFSQSVCHPPHSAGNRKPDGLLFAGSTTVLKSAKESALRSAVRRLNGTRTFLRKRRCGPDGPATGLDPHVLSVNWRPWS